MGRALTTKERARRQRTMMALRSWMEQNGVSRQEIADQLGITKGHLSTLINANRPATEAQCQKADAIMGGGMVPGAGEIKVAKKKPKPKDRPRKGKTKRDEPKARRANKLRPLTKFETEFVVEVAKSWLGANKDASKEDYIEIVRALGVGIRS